MSGLIPCTFFERDPLVCSRELIGCELRWGGRAGIIVETEAYDAEGDEASHTFFRPSARAFVAAHTPGTAYVYFNYGMHWMLNVLVKGQRQGFVLFRALEPIAGLDLMFAARKVKAERELCSGPGKLAQALGVNKAHHGMDLCSDPLYGFYPPTRTSAVVEGPRIGITRAVHLPWRFYLEDNPHVSGRPRKTNKTGRV